MKIRRSRPEADFTIIPNSTLRDDRLSYCARGVLSELLSRPNGWETNADALSDRARRHRGDIVGEGRRGLRSAFKELEAAGYMIRRKEQGEKGRFITVLEVYDTPQDRGTARATSASVTSADGRSATGTSSGSTDLRSTDEEDAADQHSSSLASAREGQQARKQDRRDRLDRLWNVVDKFSEPQLRNALLDFERKRPAIYRECRQSAISQFESGEVSVLKGESRGLATDRLSYKYAIMHYDERLPPWIVKHLRDAA
jgi:hypothetical protein